MSHAIQNPVSSDALLVTKKSSFVLNSVVCLIGLICYLFSVSFFYERFFEESLRDKLLAAFAIFGVSVFSVFSYFFTRWTFYFWLALIPLTGQISFRLGLPAFSICQLLLNAFLTGVLFKFTIDKNQVGLPLSSLKANRKFTIVVLLFILFSMISSLSFIHWMFQGFNSPVLFPHLAIFWNKLPALSQSEVLYSFQALWVLIAGLLLFSGVQCISKDFDFRKTCVKVLAFSIVSTAILGFVQYLSQWGLSEFWLVAEPNHIRISSTLPDPNSCGIILASGLFLLLALLKKNNPFCNHNLCLLFFILIDVVAIILTRSHASMIAVFFSLPLFYFLQKVPPRFQIKSLKKIKLILTISCIVLFFAFSSSVLITGNLQGGPHPESQAFRWMNNDSKIQQILKGRLNIWRSGFLMVTHKPVLGLGPGSFYQLLHFYRVNDAPVWNPVSENSHNQFLQFAAELGLLGLGFYCILLCGILWRGFKNIAHASPEVINLNCGLFCAVVCFLLASLTGHPLVLFDVNAWFWILAGLTAVDGVKS